MNGRYPDWAVDGADWPNRAASSFVDAAGYRWHAQRMGPKKGQKNAQQKDRRPIALLLHGTGAATHSWRDVMPLLGAAFDVVAPDLPGHGFTHANMAQRVSLPGMAASVSALCDAMGVQPDLIVGHSAGVAVGMQMALDRGWAVPIIGFAPALLPFPGLAARIFPSLAKILFVNPFVSTIFARMAGSPNDTRKFLERATGSRIDADTARYYARLFRHSGHCDGAIRMMANWQLEPLRDRLGDVTAPVLLTHPLCDSAIPRSAVYDAAARMPDCTVQDLPALGHLAHEEDPAGAVAIIMAFAQAQGLI